jgi:hypothetical protein
MDAFKKAKELAGAVEREKISGFVLLVGSRPQVLEVGEDRDVAVQKAMSILEESDTVIFVSKLQAKIGQNLIVKDQLFFTRK